MYLCFTTLRKFCIWSGLEVAVTWDPKPKNVGIRKTDPLSSPCGWLLKSVRVICLYICYWHIWYSHTLSNYFCLQFSSKVVLWAFIWVLKHNPLCTHLWYILQGSSPLIILSDHNGSQATCLSSLFVRNVRLRVSWTVHFACEFCLWQITVVNIFADEKRALRGLIPGGILVYSSTSL